MEAGGREQDDRITEHDGAYRDSVSGVQSVSQCWLFPSKLSGELMNVVVRWLGNMIEEKRVRI